MPRCKSYSLPTQLIKKKISGAVFRHPRVQFEVLEVPLDHFWGPGPKKSNSESQNITHFGSLLGTKSHQIGEKLKK